MSTDDRVLTALLITPVEGRGRVLRSLLRIVVTVHLVAIFAQPVFAGIFLSGNYDGLRWHQTGADLATSVGYLQLVVAIVVAVRIRLRWPLLVAAGLVAAETVQYVAGMDGALWLHLPLGVITVTAVAITFIAVWIRPLRVVRAMQQARSKQQAEGPDD